MAWRRVSDTQAPWVRLQAAIEAGDLGAARQALDDGADAQVNDFTSEGVPPLHAAARKHNLAMMALLLERGADFSVRSQSNETIFSALLVPKVEPQMLRDILALAGPLDFDKLRNAQKQTALHTAAMRHHADFCSALLEAGHDPNPVDNFGWTPLHVLVEDNPLQRDRAAATLDALLRGGADIRVRSKSGRTPFLQACARSGEGTVNAFLDAAPELAESRFNAMEAAGSFDNVETMAVILGRTGVTQAELEDFLEGIKELDSNHLRTDAMVRACLARMVLEKSVGPAPGPGKARM